MEQKCPKCGAIISENAKFCPDCGTPITKPSAEVAPKEEIKKPENVVSEAPKGDYDSLRKSDNKFNALVKVTKLCWINVAAIVLDLILVLIAILIPGFTDNYGSESSLLEVMTTNDMDFGGLLLYFVIIGGMSLVIFIVSLVQLMIQTFNKEKFVDLYHVDAGFTLQRKILRSRISSMGVVPFFFLLIVLFLPVIYDYEISPAVIVLLALGALVSYVVLIVYSAISYKIVRKQFPKDQYKRL